MKRFILYIVFFFIGSLISITAQDTYVEEYHNGHCWKTYEDNGILLSVNCCIERNSYGNWYRFDILFVNESDSTILFNDETLRAWIIRNNKRINRPVLTRDDYKYRIRVHNNLLIMAGAITSATTAMNAGYSTHNTYTNYGMVTTTTYNPTAAILANQNSAMMMGLIAKELRENYNRQAVDYLSKNTVKPGENIAGFMYMKKRNCDQLNLVITVDKQIYKFSWDPKSLKDL